MEIRDDQRALEAPTPEEMERDRRLELLLDECVASSQAPGPELTAAILAARPFAPWEVRKARAWRVPALAASGLLAASLAVFLAPLWSLGPLAAMDLWVRVIAASASGALGAALAAAPALADATGRALAGADGLEPALGGLLLVSGGSLALIARRLAKRPVRAARG
ncbi:MAG: hypothetical protein ABI768_01115 [Acidobacteriota bacterium]